MATIAENLQKIVDIKQDIKTAIENKGVTVGDSSFTDYPTLINNIPQENTGGDTTTYSYKIPTADVEGLKALGWDDESIGYFRDNNLCYDWQKDNYIVTEGNKELYGVVTKNNISTYKSDPNFIYCPMIDTSNMTNMGHMFNGCSSLQSIPLLDTSKVTDMEYMFYTCSLLTRIPLLDTSKVTNMADMFPSCTSLQSIPLLDTSKVTNMKYMFSICRSLQSIPLLDTSNVTNMDNMFSNCTSLQSIPPLNTSNVTNMDNMFSNCTSLQSIPPLNTSKVTNMANMFSSCHLLKSIPLLDCGNVTNMNEFFGWYLDINTLTDLGGFKDLKISITSKFLDKTPNLTIESLMNVINYLYDLTANGLSGQTLKFGQTNLDKLTEEQIAVATAKGWTLTA